MQRAVAAAELAESYVKAESKTKRPVGDRGSNNSGGEAMSGTGAAEGLGRARNLERLPTSSWSGTRTGRSSCSSAGKVVRGDGFPRPSPGGGGEEGGDACNDAGTTSETTSKGDDCRSSRGASTTNNHHDVDGSQDPAAHRSGGDDNDENHNHINRNKSRTRYAAVTAAAADVAKLAVIARRQAPAVGRAGRLPVGVGVLSGLDFPVSSAAATTTGTKNGAGAAAAAAALWGTARPEIGEDVVERQKKYNLHDRYLKVYLQRRFESERLPLLFAARSTSRLHGYAVNNAFQMAKKQAARMPTLC